MKLKFFLLSMMLMKLLFVLGCSSVSSSDFKQEDLLGAWKSPKGLGLNIYTEKYRLSVCPPNPKLGIVPRKSYYEIIRNGNVWIKSASTGKLKRDSKGFYIDTTPYWLGIFPIDNYSIMRKISDKEAIEILKKIGVAKADVLNLPIYPIPGNCRPCDIPFVNPDPDCSAPEIFDKL